MNRAIKVISVALILIFSGIVILSAVTNFRFGQEMNQQRREASENNWLTFQHEAFSFSFKHPPKAIIDISDPAVPGEPKRVRVRLVDPESEPNTEITDGFTFYVRSDSLTRISVNKRVNASRIGNSFTINFKNTFRLPK
jgi:hypothetical protein